MYIFYNIFSYIATGKFVDLHRRKGCMIKVFIPSDSGFKFFEPECRALYQRLQGKICDSNSFDFIRDNTFFYLFTDDDLLIGAIYYFVDSDGKLFLNGFAKRKMFEQKLRCLKLSTQWFDCDIYAQAQNRASALCLIKCGFKLVNGVGSVYVLRKNIR